MFICFSYIPPISSKVLQDQNFDFFEEIEKGLEKYSKMGKTYIVGDLNSRTAQESDILDFDIYLDNIQKDDDDDDDDFLNDYLNSIYSRNNHVIDKNGRKLLSLCKATDHIIANGRLHKDQNGEFTFCCKRGSSVTDYLLLNIFDIKTLKHFEILQWNNFSDHAAKNYSVFSKHTHMNPKIKVQMNRNMKKKIVFDESRTNEFQHYLNHNIQIFDTQFDSDPHVTKQIENLTDFLVESSRDIFVKRIPIGNNKKSPHINTPKWFNEQCYTTKQEFKPEDQWSCQRSPEICFICQ